MSYAIRRSIAFVAATGIGLSTAAATCIPYVNDFATRTSGPTPTDRWLETSYSVGSLCRSLNSVSATTPYVGELQDGWAMKSGAASANVAFSVVSENGNQGALVNPAAGSWCSNVAIVQPLANEFKTGTLKITADIRTPFAGESIRSDANAFAMIAPLCKSGLDVAATRLPMPMRMGPGCFYDNRSGKEGWHIRAITRGPSSNYGQYDTHNALVQGNWYRYTAEINLEAGTYKGTFADLGSAHPTAATVPMTTLNFRTYEPGSGSSEPTTMNLESTLTETSGGIAGLAVFVGNHKPADAAKAPMIDNVSVAWKAPGTDAFVSVYENDFTTRRVRTVEPQGSTCGTYDSSHWTVDTTSAPYDHGTWENAYGVNDTTACAALEGIDSWKRIAGTTKFTLLDPNKNGGYGWQSGTILRATGKSTQGVVAAPLGTTITGGKVRFSFDLLPGRKSVLGSFTEAYAICYLAGNKAAESSSTSTSISTILSGKAVCGGGYYVNGSANSELNPGRIVYGTGSYKSDYKDASNSTVEADMCKWHRFVVTADLDARTFVLKVNRAAGSDVYDYDHATEFTFKAEGSNGFMSNAPANIDSIIIATQGQGNYTEYGAYGTKNMGKFPLFDNLKVCRVNADGTDGELIYSCDFNTSVRTKSYDGALMTTAIDRPGADGWMLRGPNTGSIYAAGTSNPAVVLDDIDSLSGVVQSLGTTSKGCAKMTFAADLRPPKTWRRQDGSFAVEIGGDAYYQGNLAVGNLWRAAPRLSFGFTPSGLTVGTATATATSAAVIDPTHWYRFRVAAKPLEGAYTVTVCDQGIAQPQSSDKDGAVIATFNEAALPFRTDVPMTSVGLCGCGIKGSLGGGLLDPDVALVDNLSANGSPMGLAIILK